MAQRGRQAEAARNDLLLLTAAREVFSAQGFDAPVSAVAERAGVGIGSLYRRYGTKEELLQHLCVVAMQQAAEAAREALQRADPWDGLTHYISACVEFGSGGLAPIAGHIQTTPEMWETHKLARRHADRLIRRARSAGVLRPGASGLDIALLIEQFSRRPGPGDEEQDNARRRLLAIAIDGLHARNSDPLPGRAPSRRRYEGRWVPPD
jgi:AcrR family transcriptional regulator